MFEPRLDRIVVIIVNYNTAELAIAAADSVLTRGHGGRQVSVHLIDNASNAQDVALLHEAHNQWQGAVRLYFENANHGFGGGNNIVLRAILAQAQPPDAVFLLNPDAMLGNETIDLLACALEAHPEVGFAGAAIQGIDKTPSVAAFRFPSLVSEFSDVTAFGPVARMCKPWQVPLAPKHPEGVVDWVSGAAVMVRTDCLNDVGLFDENFFLYYEEVDLMHRAQDLGWLAWYAPDAWVTHDEGAATQVKEGAAQRRRRPAYLYHSWQYYFKKHHGRLCAFAIATAYILGAGLNVVQRRLRGLGPTLPQRFFRDFMALAIRPILSR